LIAALVLHEVANTSSFGFFRVPFSNRATAVPLKR